jgi:hypothetical protein
VLRQRVAGGRRQPLRQLRRRHAQHRRAVQAVVQALRNGCGVADEPDAIEPILFAAQAFAQLALQIELLLAECIAARIRHGHQQPLALEGRQPHRRAVARGRDQVGHRALGIDEFAVDPPALGPDHVVGEVRSDHRRRAAQHDQDHLPAADHGTPPFRAVERLARRGHRVHGQAERLVSCGGHGARGGRGR